MTFLTGAMLAAGLFVQTLTFSTVTSGLASQIDEPKEVVIRTQAEWQTFWRTHSTQPVPAVDFTKSIVAGVFLGMRPSGGYGVVVTAVRRTPAGAVVEYVSSSPDKDKMVMQMLTSPFHLVAIPADIAKVEFKQVTGGR